MNQAVIDRDLSSKVSKQKIVQMSDLPSVIARHQQQGEVVGIIGGCFDVLHIGHIEVFRFALKYVDCLCVVLDNDNTIAATKGEGRPVFNQNIRAEQMAELHSVGIVTVWDQDIPARSDIAYQRWFHLLESAKAEVFITNSEADVYWKDKQEHCNNLGMKFLDCHLRRLTSSTELVDSLAGNVNT